MADRDALDTYLNDHLAGARGGVDLAKEIASDCEGSPLAPETAQLAADIEADRDTLQGLMDALRIEKGASKQTVGWMAEKLSRLRLNRAAAGSQEMSVLLSLEMLSMGVEAKRSLWQVLSEVAPQLPGVSQVELSTLVKRAEDQIDRLVALRRAVGVAALS